MNEAIAVPAEFDSFLKRLQVVPPPNSSGTGGVLYGKSDPMHKVYEMIGKVAPTEATVLIVGESGTGKEVVARAIHEASRRRDHAFIPVNCGAIPANLIEAELFGYERGSFTGAHKMHRGVFERAADGTLLLDEITEMSPELQVKLLRVLESGTFCRVGGDAEISVRVRLIAATNRQIRKSVAEGQLREDLMYRLAVFPIELPPLRERGDDITLLAQHFLDALNEVHSANKTFSSQALGLLRGHDWPGNVRELKNVVERAFILADGTVELAGLLQPAGAAKQAAGECLRFPVGTRLDEAERHLIFATLDHCGGNKKRTAETLGVSLKTLYNRLSGYRQLSAGLN